VGSSFSQEAAEPPAAPHLSPRRHHDHWRDRRDLFGVNAERKPLEQMATPLTEIDT
jgi:hypothetical protein